VPNCQSFVHTQNYCYKQYLGVKYGEEHKTVDFIKPKKTKAKCAARCGEAHTTIWKGCSAYEKSEERAPQERFLTTLSTKTSEN